MILFVVALLLALVVLLSLSRTPALATRSAAPLVAVLAYLLPAVALLLAFLLNREEATRFRFALLGFGFRTEAGVPLAVEIGGDRVRSPLWVGALGEEGAGPAAGWLRFQPAQANAAQGTLRVQAVPAATGFLGWRRSGTRLTPLQTVALEDGDVLHVGGRSWTIRLPGEAFGAPARFEDGAGHVVELPARRTTVPLLVKDVSLPVARPLPASEETFPLAYLELAAGGSLPTPAPRGFLFRQPGFRSGGVYVANPDGAATVERRGQAVTPPADHPLAPSDALHVLSYPRWNESGFSAGGLRDRRSFRADVGRQAFVLELESKEVYALPWRRATPDDPRIGVEDLALGPLAQGGGTAPLRLSLAMGDWQFLDRNLHFEHAGDRLASEALAIFELPRRPKGDDKYTAATPRGLSEGAFGRPQWLGSANLSAVQLDVLRPPVWLGVFALLLVGFKAVAALAARLTVTQVAMAAALEGLLALRLLLGFRAWAMDPFSDESYRLALIAWSLLSWGFLVAALPGSSWRDEGERSALVELPVWGGLLVSAAWCWRFSGGGTHGVVWLACHVALAALPWARRVPEAWLAKVRQWSATLRRWIGRLLPQRLATRARAGLQTAGRWIASAAAALRKDGWQLVSWALAGLVPGLVRLVLVLLGAKESLPLFGQRFALTLVHVPLAVVLQGSYVAWVWRRTTRRGRVRALDLLPGLAFLFGTWVLPAPLVNDFGLALLNVPVLLLGLSLLAFAGLRLARDLGERGWRLVAPPVALAGVLAACLLVTASPAGARVFADVISRLKGEELVERNYLRLLAFSYREKLEGLALRSSEEMAVMNAVMDRYTSRPLRQCRYFSSEVSPHLRATALREHAVAVFLAPEWGLFGVLGALLLYVVAAAAGLSVAPWRAAASWDEDGSLVRSSAFGRGVAFFAGLTLAIPSVYMVLANYRLTLFTGKNPYLFGLDSTADVLETLALAAIFALGTALVREREEDE